MVQIRHGARPAPQRHCHGAEPTIAETPGSLKTPAWGRPGGYDRPETGRFPRGYVPEERATYFIRKAYSMSRSTICSSAVRFPFVFSSRTESRSMISLAWGRFTGMGCCWGSSRSPISINDEEPREITNEENVTGMAGAWLEDPASAGCVSGLGSLGAAALGAGSPPPPRRSRTTKPSSCVAMAPSPLQRAVRGTLP